MEKLSRKVSVLGLVLLGASAVTAAILPSKSKDSLRIGDGVLVENSITALGVDLQFTCVTAQSGQNCFDTETAGAGSTTSAASGTSATAGTGNTTAGS